MKEISINSSTYEVLESTFGALQVGDKFIYVNPKIISGLKTGVPKKATIWECESKEPNFFQAVSAKETENVMILSERTTAFKSHRYAVTFDQPVFILNPNDDRIEFENQYREDNV